MADLKAKGFCELGWGWGLGWIRDGGETRMEIIKHQMGLGRIGMKWIWDWDWELIRRRMKQGLKKSW